MEETEYAKDRIAALNRDVKKRMAVVKKSYIALQSAKKQCLETAYQQMSGMFCASCDPNWKRWLVKGADGSYEMNMDKGICKKLTGKCHGYLQEMERSSETALEIFKINKFLAHNDQIVQLIQSNDYKGLKKLYLASNSLTEKEWSSFIAAHKPYQMPETCDEAHCPYICEKLITPSGFHAPDFAMKDGAVKKAGFLSKAAKKEIASLKIRYVEDKVSVNPAAMSKGMDTTSEIKKGLALSLSDQEKELLRQEVEKDLYRDYDRPDEEDSARVSAKEELKSQIQTRALIEFKFSGSFKSALLSGALLMYLFGLMLRD